MFNPLTPLMNNHYINENNFFTFTAMIGNYFPFVNVVEV